MPGLPVPHHLPKFAQVRVHCIGDVIQPSHPLMPSSPSALTTFSCMLPMEALLTGPEAPYNTQS